MDNVEYGIRREVEAARILFAGIRTMFAEDDPQLLADSIEGETNLLESIDVAIAEIDETEALIAGLKQKESQFTERRRGMEERVKRVRSLVEQAMAISEQPKLRRPSATLTLRRLPPDVVVMSEADIPAEFFVPQPPPPPKLDKAALREALKARDQKMQAASCLEDIAERQQALSAIPTLPGAVLNNGGFSLQIRRS